MSDIQNLKKVKTFEEEEEINLEEIKGYAFLDEAECVVNQIIEKIISLVMTEITKNKVNKLIPNYCFVEIKQILEIITHLDFLNHDKDDLKVKKHIPLERIKSAKYIKKGNNEKENEEKYDKSEILRDYKINDKTDSFNADIFNLTKNEIIEREKEMNKEKLIMGFLKRQPHQEVMTSFQKEEEKKRKMIENNNKKFNYNFYDDRDKIYNEIYSEKEPFQVNPEEKIENIKNVEIHKIEISPSHPLIHKSPNIEFDTIIDSNNYWNPLSEPKAAPIDRDAATKIKYEKPVISKKKLVVINPKDVVIEEQKNSNKKSSKKIRFNFSSKKVNNLDKNKKKKYVQIEFESYDLDPKKYISEYDTSEMAELRINLEKELEEKKKEQEKIAKKERERLEQEEKIAELRKELSKKNVTVDIKGELVFIKPIDLNALTEEFNKGKSKLKLIKTIEEESNYIKDSKDIIIERNREIDLFDNKDDKNKKKQKRKKEEMFKQKNNNTNSSKKSEQKGVFDKNNMKYASGSNFGIMSPEIGVNIMEEKRVKSGGKDFYKKFNKYSVELFQDHLSKTTSNFYPKNKENIEENNDTKKRRGSLSSVKEKIKKDMDNLLINTRQPTEDNNTLSLKTKNLKIALENLDLVLEEKDLDNHKKLIKKNFIKDKLKEIRVRKINFNEMNVFTKTLVGNDNWGSNLYSERRKRSIYKIPTKPEENELQRELPISILKHLPRKRLPPIINNLRGNNKMGKTIASGFFTNRKPVKLKLANGENKNSVKSVDDKAINNKINDFTNDNEI